jgi:hypothetical protein
VDKEVEVNAVHQDNQVGVRDHGRVNGDGFAWRGKERVAIREVVIINVYRNLGEDLVAGNRGTTEGD